VKPAPFPRDLTLRIPPGAKPERPQEDDTTEYVIERVISHGRSESGELVVRVRWAGYESTDDTWEKATYMPHNVLVKYERLKKLSRCTVS
jgi:Chromo (CHRromatin Organisation MOdifier) domain